jgi:hypothetical protein
MSSGKVFLSYRRDDTAGYAGRLFDRLNARFRNRIFMDVEGVKLGADFIEEIERAVGTCQVLIALLGKQWLTMEDANGRRRIDRPDDFVRLEIATALRRNIRVIPVLIGDTKLPAAETLPRDLAKLCRRQALHLTDSSFDQDVERLIGTLDLELSGPRKPMEKPLPQISLSTRQRRIGLACAAGILVVAAALQFLPTASDRPSPRQPEPPGKIDEPSGPLTPVEAKTVQIRLSDDGIARVFRDGKEVGATPFNLSGHFGEKIDLTFRRPGFRDRQQSIQISERGLYLVSMERDQ